MTGNAKPTYEELEHRCLELQATADRLVRAEERETHIKRVLLGIRNVNQLIVQEDNPVRLIERACRNLTETMGYERAWIALLGEPARQAAGVQGQGPLVAVASSGFHGGFQVLEQMLAQGELPECARGALSRDDLVVTRNLLEHCRNCPLSAQYGEQAGLSRRLCYEGNTYGVLTVSVPASYALDEEEQDLFEEVAGDLAFALHKIRSAVLLHREHRRLEFVIEGARLGTWEWNVQTDETVFNETWASMLGYTLEELRPLGYETWARLLHPDDLPIAAERLRRCAEDEDPQYECEFRMRHKDGHWVWILDRGRVLERDSAGQPLSMFGTHTDITQRMRTEETLRDSEERHRRLFETMAQGVVYQAADGRIISANPSAERILGLPLARMQDMTSEAPDWDAVTEDGSSLPATEHPSMVALRTGEPVTSFRMGVRNQDTGERVWISVWAIPLFRPGESSPFQVYTTFPDITRRVQAERALRRQEHYLRTILETTVDAFWVIDAQARVCDANEAWGRMLGRTRDEVLGLTIADIDAAEKPEETAAHIRHVMENGSDSFETRHRRKDGSVFPIEVSTTFLDEQGGRFICFGRDLTARKQTEAALRQSENQFRALFMASPVSIIVHDKDTGEIVDANPSAIASYGCSSLAEMQANDFWLDPPYSFDDALAWIHKAVEEGPQVFEWQSARRSGDIFWEHVHLSRVTINGVDRILATSLDMTERKRADAALRESEERFRQVYEHMPVGVARVSLDSRIESANEAYCSMLGYSQRELVGKHLRDITEAETADENLRLQAQLVAGEIDHFRIEKTYVHKDGSPIAALLVACLVRDAAGRPSYCLGSVVDITDRKRTEDALRESEQKWRHVLVNTPQIGIGLDTQARIIFANKHFLELTGRSAEEVLGRDWFDLFIPERLRAVVRRVFARAMDSGKTLGLSSFENEILTRSGEERSVAWSNVVTKDANGAVLDVTCLGVDVTERIRANAEIKYQAGLITSLLDSIPDIIFFKDVDSVYLGCNAEFTRHVGRSKQEVVGKTDFDLYTKEQAEAFRENDRVMLESGTPRHNEEWVRYPDGRAVLLDTLKAPFRDSDGNLVGVLGISRDITEQRNAEKEREQLEEQYRQAQKMEAIGQLTGGVAHDFNNLLQVINGYTDLSLETLEKDHPVRNLLEDVARAGDRAARLVSQLLAFSRRQIMRPEHLILNDVVSDILKMLRRVIGEHVQLQWHPASREICVHADRGMIEQVLMNLAVNARDAMPQGGLLTISSSDVVIDRAFRASHPWAAEGKYALLRVGDTGCGMDAETLEHVFEPFFTTKELGRGTGLGLATVYGIVKQHGGQIDVRSTPGKGTTFDLFWPVSEGGANAVREDAEGPSPGGNETILLAEDDGMVRNLARSVLEQAGYRVLTASNGSEAVEVVEKQGEEINLVVLDVVMPEMGGREAWEHMRLLRPDLRALFVSGYSEHAMHANFVLEKGLTLLQKPFERDVFLQSVRALLEGRKP